MEKIDYDLLHDEVNIYMNDNSKMYLTNKYINLNANNIILNDFSTIYFNQAEINAINLQINDKAFINGVGLGYAAGQAAPGCYTYNNNYAGGYHW